MACPQCGGQMKVVAFIEPPQREVIEKILKHGGLWPASSARPPPVGNESYGDRDDVTCRSPVGSHERTYVDQGTFILGANYLDQRRASAPGAALGHPCQFPRA